VERVWEWMCLCVYWYFTPLFRYAEIKMDLQGRVLRLEKLKKLREEAAAEVPSYIE